MPAREEFEKEWNALPGAPGTKGMCKWWFMKGRAAREVAAQHVAEADRAGRAGQARPWVEKIHKASADVLHGHEEGQDVELVALTILDWAQRALAALGPAA
jgi:hypothetical protein